MAAKTLGALALLVAVTATVALPQVALAEEPPATCTFKKGFGNSDYLLAVQRVNVAIEAMKASPGDEDTIDKFRDAQSKLGNLVWVRIRDCGLHAAAMDFGSGMFGLDAGWNEKK